MAPIGLLVALITLSSVTQAQIAGSASSDILVIDGKKHPELEGIVQSASFGE